MPHTDHGVDPAFGFSLKEPEGRHAYMSAPTISTEMPYVDSDGGQWVASVEYVFADGAASLVGLTLRRYQDGVETDPNFGDRPAVVSLGDDWEPLTTLRHVKVSELDRQARGRLRARFDEEMAAETNDLSDLGRASRGLAWSRRELVDSEPVTKATRGRPVTYGDDHYAEVLRVVADAELSGRPTGPAVAEHFGLGSGNARTHIRNANAWRQEQNKGAQA